MAAAAPPPLPGAAAQAAPERPLARPAAPVAPQAPGSSALSFEPAEISQVAGSTFAVNIAIAGAQDIYAVPLQISYDPASLQVLNVSNGDFLSRDGQVVTLVHRDPPGEGNLQVTAARPPQAGGVSGAGAVLTITFLAKAKGQSALTIRAPVLRNSAMQAVPATAAPASVTIR